jgi:hypothetical protein
MSVIEQFWGLCDEARRLSETTLDSREREPAFLAVLNFILDHPEERAAFAYCFLHLFHWPELGPWNLIEYCMRELRWEEVRSHLAGIAAVTPEINCRFIANYILTAFQDPWPHGRFYARYERDGSGDAGGPRPVADTTPTRASTREDSCAANPGP